MPLDEKQFRDNYSEKSAELRAQNAELRATLQSYRREHGKLEVFFEDVISSITPAREFEPFIMPGAKKTGTLVHPVLHITDTHKGGKQDANEIEGFNEFNPEIATARSIRAAEETVKWANYQKLAYHIENITLIFTGDLMSGDIHDELRITNAYPTPVQVVESTLDIVSQVQIIAPHFKQVTLEFISEDNHARLTKKPQAKEAGLNSMNYLIGKMVEAYVRDISNVKMNIYPMLEKVIHVNERQYLITHGHTIRGWMGVPWYGVERRVSKEAQSRLQLMMEDLTRAKEIGFHKFVFGHWHTPIDTPLYSCGASLQGTDAYDHQDGRYAGPGQSAWLVHPKHGEFNRINFNLA